MRTRTLFLGGLLAAACSGREDLAVTPATMEASRWREEVFTLTGLDAATYLRQDGRWLATVPDLRVRMGGVDARVVEATGSALRARLTDALRVGVHDVDVRARGDLYLARHALTVWESDAGAGDTDTDADTDSDADTDTDSDADTDTDTDTDTECGLDPEPPGAGDCPAVCTGGCDAANVCVIDCAAERACRGNTLDCPPGYACSIVCTGREACDGGTVNCADGLACTVTCSEGDSACKGTDVNCGAASSCDVSCDLDRCEGMDVFCGAGACSMTCAGGRLPRAHCDAACSCEPC